MNRTQLSDRSPFSWQALRACALLLVVFAQAVMAQEQEAQDMPPPRIGMVSGSASFWRPGADNWSAAQVNTALAAGDALHTGAGATLEVQIGSRAYLRLAQNATLSVLDIEPNFQQFKITAGIVAFDLRNLRANRGIEVATPAGAFNIDSAGYYRIEVSDRATHFIVRRGGEATVTLADGGSRLIAPSQEAVVDSGDVDTYVAPDSDAWDNWNYARTDDLIDAISNRYVSPEMYGTDDLDHYGNWRTTPDYGTVWVPSGMASDWAPYSNGAWVWDPVYAWTWVDAAPWGWAPYHYGRWIRLNGFWAWAPGPRHHRPAYAPALVAFFHGNGGGARIGIGGPSVSWVALGWGEPCLPWWGRSGFVGRPWWGGWAGPRGAGNTHYRNLGHDNAVITLPEKNFGHGRIADTRRLEPGHAKELRPIVGRHPLRPNAKSMMPTTTRSDVPAASVINRPAVILHRPPQRTVPWQVEGHEATPARPAMPDSQNIPVRPRQGQQVPWARFGRATGPERDAPRRAPEPPRVETWSPAAAPTLRQENHVPAPAAVEAARPQQQLPAQATGVPQMQQRQQAPARSTEPTPTFMRPEAPKAPVSVPPQAVRPLPQRELLPQNARPEVFAPGQSRDMRQEHRELPREVRREEREALPGQPANRLYRRPAGSN